MRRTGLPCAARGCRAPARSTKELEKHIDFTALAGKLGQLSEQDNPQRKTVFSLLDRVREPILAARRNRCGRRPEPGGWNRIRDRLAGRASHGRIRRLVPGGSLTRFQRLAAATVATVFLLVTIGVVVRATGSGEAPTSAVGRTPAAPAASRAT